MVLTRPRPMQQDAGSASEQEPVALNIERKVKTDGHGKVVDIALPLLLKVLRSDEHCAKPPRDQVRVCLGMVLYSQVFWGAKLWFTRKRTVEDLILKFYFDEVKALL